MPVVIAPGSALAGIEVEQEVTYNNGNGVVYAGRIRAIDPDDLRPSAIGLAIDCQDYTSLLIDEVCTGSRSIVETDAQRISWLLQTFDRRGLTAYHVQTLYSAMPTQDFAGMTLDKAIKAVLQFSGGQFYVDFAKDLHTFVSETSLAPFALSDSPDGATSFGYADFDYPRDSVDLRNAVYVIGGEPSAPTQVVETVTAAGGASDIAAAWAVFSAAANDRASLVGATGPFTVGSNSAVNPILANGTRAGNLLVAWVESDSVGATTSAPGWLQASTFTNSHGPWVTLFYKPNCSTNEVAPQFTSTGVAPMKAQLAEFAGIAPAPLKRSGGANATSGPIGLSNIAKGDLILLGASAFQPISGTASFSEVSDGPVFKRIGDDGAVGDQNHAAHSYALMRPLATWYTDDASSATYGRRETSFTASDVLAQADLDATGAAYLASHAKPIRQASCKVDQPGLAAGQVVVITNALYGLTAQQFRIQAVEISFRENTPRFAVQFADATVDLTTQMVALQEQASAATSTATTIAAGPLGTLAYAELLANQTGIVAETDVSLCTVTVNVGSSGLRRIKITGVLPQTDNSIAGTWGALSIYEDGAIIQRAVFEWVATTSEYFVEASVVKIPTAGTHTYKLRLDPRIIGAGTARIIGASNTINYILVEDIGT